jgi:hypothetical protein
MVEFETKRKDPFKQRNIIARRECSSKQEKKIGLIKPRLYELEPSL